MTLHQIICFILGQMWMWIVSRDGFCWYLWY
jgi:hypothetical protein